MGKQQHLGMFDTAKKVAIAFDLAAVQAKRLKSDLNFRFLHDCRVIEIIPRIKKRRIMRWTNKKSFNGVFKKRKTYRANISIDNELKYLDIFVKARDAAMAHNLAIVEKRLNFLEELQ